MHSRTACSSTAPTVAQKSPRPHSRYPQYRFRKCGNSSCNRRDERPLLLLYSQLSP